MKRARIIAFVAAGLQACGLVVAAARGSDRQQTRDLRVEPKGTGVISGIVETDDSSHRPLRLAVLSIAGDALLTGRQTMTSNDGRFEFAGLPAGQYTLSVYAAAFMRTNYGATRPGGSGSAIVIADGQRVTELRLRLPRYGRITGVIYDQDGEPVQRMSVEALHYTMRTGRRALSSTQGLAATTDDRGVYQIGGLLPGRYYVAAGPGPDLKPMDLQALSTADVDRVLQIASGSSSASLDSFTFTRPRQSYAPVYFPGATDFSRAQVIELGVGEERAGVDIRLQLVPAARLEGLLVGPDGRPPFSAQVTMVPIFEAGSLDLFSPAIFGTVTVDALGRFLYPAVPPGTYRITARTPRIPPRDNGDPIPPMWAQSEVAVNGTDQFPQLVLQPAGSVSGRFVFSGSTPPPANLAAMRVSIPGWMTGFGQAVGTLTGTANADGTFVINDVGPGKYPLTANAPSSAPGWSLRSAMVDGVDALDTPFVARPGQNTENVVITFTDRPTELSGTLQTPAGIPTADYFIVVFAADRAFWTPSTRRSVSARPASNGRYVARNLPPGDYLVAAVTDVQQGDWWDPEFLAKLATVATKVTLTESEKKTLDLRIGG